MYLFGRIFRKRPVGTEAALDTALDTALDGALDDSLLAIGRELSGLAELPVSPAAKERGWARLERELERRPVRSAQSGSRPAARRSARPARTWRWALGPAAAAVAVVATLLGVYGGGLLQTADSGDRPTSVTSVVSADSTEPPTTVSTDGTTPDTVGPGTTGVQPGTTQGPVPTDGTVSTGGSVPTGGPGTTGGSASPTTTKPPAPSTTGSTQYAAGEREGSAKAVTLYLADLVITGNTSGARALVAPEAQSSLTQMVMSLNDPYGYLFTGVQLLTSDTVRVTLDISDRVADGQGQLVEATKSFAVRVRLDGKSAIIIAINGV